jgi:hypothetical protein
VTDRIDGLGRALQETVAGRDYEHERAEKWRTRAVRLAEAVAQAKAAQGPERRSQAARALQQAQDAVTDLLGREWSA